MKQCTQSPATTGLVVTYSKSSPTPQVFFLGTRFCVVIFAPPCTCVSLMRSKFFTHGHARSSCSLPRRTDERDISFAYIPSTLRRCACTCFSCLRHTVCIYVLHAYVVSCVIVGTALVLFAVCRLICFFPPSFFVFYLHARIYTRATIAEAEDKNARRSSKRIKRVSYLFFFFKFFLESLPLFARVIKTLLIVHPSLLFVCCLSISVLVVVLFTVHCKMDSSPIVTTHTNNKSKSSRKSLISPSKISSKSLNPEGTRRRKPLS